MSQTYLGIYTMLLGALTEWLGVPLVDGQAEDFVKTVLVIGGALWAMWGRRRLGGTNVFGFRQPK